MNYNDIRQSGSPTIGSEVPGQNKIGGVKAPLEQTHSKRSGSPTQKLEIDDSEPARIFEEASEFFDRFKTAMKSLNPDDNFMSDDVLKLIEDALCLIFQVYCLSRTKDRFIAITMFFKLRSKSPLSKTFISTIKKILEDIPEHKPVKPKYTVHYELQEGSETTTYVDHTRVRDLLDNWDHLEDSPITEKIRNLMGYVMAFSILEHLGLQGGFAELIYNEFNVQKKPPKVSSFFYSILDVIEFVTMRARTCYNSGSIKPLFHCSDTYNKWVDQVCKVKMWSKMLDCPEAEGFTEHQYIKELEDCIDYGKQMINLAKRDGTRAKLNNTISDLCVLRSDFLTKKKAAQTRKLPFTLLLAGDTSVGKTYISAMLIDYFSKLRNLPNGDEYRYSRNYNDEFFSGFNSQCLYVFLDDIAAIHPNVAVGGDPSLMEMLQMINPAPFTTNQAELEKKGKVPFLPEFIIASTNTRTLNVDKYFSFPSAVQRRFPYILTPRVRPEYTQEHSNMMAGNKVPDVEYGKYSNLWTFDVHRIKPQPLAERGKSGKKLAEEVPVLTDATLTDMLIWMRDVVDKHYKEQEKMIRNTKMMKTVQICTVTKLPVTLCTDCEVCTPQPLKEEVQLQSGNVEETGCSHCSSPCCLPEWDHFSHCKGICKKCQFCVTEADVVDQSCTNCFYFSGGLTCPYCRDLINYTQALSSDCEFCKDFFTFDHNPNSDLELQVGWTTRDTYAEMFTRPGEFFTMLFTCWYLSFLSSLNVFKFKLKGFFPRRFLKDTPSDEPVLTFREEMVALGKEVEDTLIKRPEMRTLGIVLSTVIVMKLAMEVYHRFQPKPKRVVNASSFIEDDTMQGGKLSGQAEAVVPLPMVDEGFNPWKNDDYKLTDVDTTRMIRSYKGLSEDQLTKILLENLASVRIRKPGNTYVPANMFCICDRYFAINNHSIPDEDEFFMDIFFNEDKPGITSNLRSVAIGKDQITHISGDFSMIFIPQIRPRKDLRQLFPRPTLAVKSNGFYLHRDDGGKHKSLPVENITKQVMDNVKIDGIVDAYQGFVNDPTQKGFCGSVLVLNTSHGPVISGLHYLGSKEGITLAFSITLDDITTYFKDKVVLEPGYITLNCSRNDFELQGLHNKSPARYIEHGVAECYGSLDGFRAKPKSRVGSTYVADYWKRSRNIKDTHGPPVMAGYLPWRHGLIPMVEDNFKLSWSKLRKASIGYLEDIIRDLPPSEADLLEIYDFETSLNGCAGVQYVDKIDFSTSAGFPFMASKKHLVIPRLDDNNKPTGFVDVCPEISQAYNSIIDRYKRGERANPIFSANLKDEARQFEKILKGQTRIMSSSPFAFTLVTRHYCASFVRVIQRNRLIFECAVGINAHSTEWDNFVKHINVFGDDMFDGDYKNYDKSMMSMLIYEAALTPWRLMKHYNPEKAEIMKVEYHCLAADLAYSWVNYNGDILTFFRNNPSGHALTVIVNCIVNSYYFRLAFLDNKPPDVSVRDFKKYVRLVTYGDDFVAGVNSSESPWFNFDTVRKSMLSFGVVLTRADKQEGTYKYKRLSEMDFLKRRFVFDERLQRYVAPLALTSIEKSLIICTRSTTVSAQHQSVSCMSSALREMFFHGKEEFETFRCQILDCLDEYNLHNYVGRSDFPTHEELFNYYSTQNITAYKPDSTFYIEETILELQGSCLSRGQKLAEDILMRQRLRYFRGKKDGDKVHPQQVVPIRHNHYQGVGIKAGQLCLVEYISQKAYIGSSYCWNHIPLLCERSSERGLSIHFHMGDPHSPYLRTEHSELKAKDWGETESYWPRFRRK